MTQMENRDELQLKYIKTLLDDMSLEQLCKFFIDTMNRDLDDLDDDELVEEVKNFVPELFND